MARRRLPALLVLLLFCGGSFAVRAQPAEDEGPTAQPTVDAILKEVAERYGPAAVALQGFLLAHAITAGSQLEVTVSVAGIESRTGRNYLGYVLDTGIVYQVADVSKREQLSRIFTDVIDPSLRKATLVQLRADGLALRVSSYRSELTDRAALARAHQAHRLQRVETNFFLPLDAIQAFIDGQIAAAELSQRGSVEMDGATTQLEIIPTPIPTVEPTLAPE